MIPTQVREPFHRDGWVYEEKVDGWRILAHKDGARVWLLSRTGVDHARGGSRSSRRRSRAWRPHTPPIYVAFDVLYAEGVDVTGRPLGEWRIQLEDLVTSADLVLPVRRLAPHGLEASAQVLKRGYEGWVGKDEASPYRGGVTRSWLKVKVPGWTVEGDQWARAKL
jgi:bifunctional non-homologous end joining protein LigD